MRAFPTLLLVAAGMALCTGALAQDRPGARTPSAPGAAATTGAAPSAPTMQAPIGHRQPKADADPGNSINFAPISPYDQQIDRNLNICRGC